MNIKSSLGLGLVMVATLGTFGCASTGGIAGRATALDFEGAEPSSLRLVASRSVDSRMQPMVPVHMATDGSSVAITFAERGRQQVVTKLDPASLSLMSSEKTGRSEEPAAPSAGADRVQLEDGRSVECWTHQNADGGRQAMAQMWTASGARLGAPLVLSAPDADVIGALRAATADGRHVLVTFAATSGESFELRAVSLEDARRAADSEQTARR
jgi:hypothetical protein